MREFNEDVKKALSETRIRIAETAYNHVTTAIHLFERGQYSQACFFGITAIEEMGKARTLQIVQSDAIHEEEPDKIDAKGIERFLREHKLKATRAAASGLSVNHAAVQRHGRHEEADLNLPSGILFLTESNQWMKIRNSCIYVDVNLHPKVVEWPSKLIDYDYAYYFISMALEIIAKESDAGFGSPIEELQTSGKQTDFQTANQFEDAIIEILSWFMLEYREQFDETNLDFFTEHPQYDDIREEIREKEVGKDDERRSEVKGMVQKMVENLEEPSKEEKEEHLSEGVSYDQYQEAILENMVNIGMDMPYFTNPGMHPDIRELQDQIQGYLKYE